MAGEHKRFEAIFTRGDKLEDGHYTVIKELGVGGMGVVYQCRDEQLMRDVALKMLLPELMADKSNVEIFRQEARLAAQLEHPNIVTVYEFGVEERNKKQHHYVAMEYLPGGNLANRVVSGPLAVEHCLNWMKQLVSGLSFAHKRGVIHQDMKADNIFITTEGDLKIGDFGLARLLAGRVHSNSSMRGMGTPAYMSPELCRGEHQDHRSDIYSLGVLFFEMATGQLPFRARGMIEMATKHSSAPIPSAKRINPLIPDVIDRMIKRMMAKTPEERYASAGEILNILDELIFQLRVARLGLAQTPLLRSGPIYSEVGGAAAHEGQPATAVEHAEAGDGQTKLPYGAKSPSEALMLDLEKEQGGLKAKTTGVGPGPGPGQMIPPAGKKLSDFVVSQRISKENQAVPSAKSSPAQAPKSSSAAGKAAVPDKTSQHRASFGATGSKLKVISLPPKSKPSLDMEWSFSTKGPIGWSSSPVLDRDERTIYFTSCDGCVYSLDGETGAENWRHQTNSPIVGSPVLVGDTVTAVNIKGETVSLDAKSGDAVWSLSLAEESIAAPCSSKAMIFVATTSGKLVALDIATGRRKWIYKAEAPIVAAPQRHSDLVLVGTKGGCFHAVSAQDGSKIWTYSAIGSIVGTVAASVDSVYFGTQRGAFYALEAASGALIWEYPTERAIVSGAVIVFTSVIFAGDDRWLYCCEKYDGSLKWKSAVRGKVMGNLVATKDLLVLVTQDGWLQAFETQGGKLAWQRDLGRRVDAAPLISSERLYVATVEGELKAYSLKPES